MSHKLPSAFWLDPNRSLRVHQAIAPGDLDRKGPLHFPASAQQPSFHYLFDRHVYPVQQPSAYSSFFSATYLSPPKLTSSLFGGVQSQSSIHHLLRGSQSESFSQVLWRHAHFTIKGEFALITYTYTKASFSHSFANYWLIKHHTHLKSFPLTHNISKLLS